MYSTLTNPDLTACPLCTPPRIAAVVATLLGAGADPNATLDDGATSLYVSVVSNNEAVVAALLRAGAQVDKAVHDGKTPLFVAAEQGNHSMVETLLAAGAQASKATITGATPCSIAMQEGHGLVVAALTSHRSINPIQRASSDAQNSEVAEGLATDVENATAAAAALRVGKSTCSGCKVALVEGRLKECPNCKAGEGAEGRRHFFCSNECFAATWKEHKKEHLRQSK